MSEFLKNKYKGGNDCAKEPADIAAGGETAANAASTPSTATSDPSTVASDPSTVASDPSTAASAPSTAVSDPSAAASDSSAAAGRTEQATGKAGANELSEPADAAAFDEAAFFAEAERALQRRLSHRTRFAMVIIMLLIPLTIAFGILVLDDRSYYFISLALVVLASLPFFVAFENRRPQVREMVVIAVLVALAVVGRLAFFMLPQFKPVVAIVIIAGICLGGESGFVVGALTGFISNFYFGQGPWTPWQMFAFGIIGFLAGVLFARGRLSIRRLPLCSFGFITTFVIYGGLVDFGSLTMYSSGFSWQALLAVYTAGVPFNLIHAASTAIFLWFIAEPMIGKLERIKLKHGLLQKPL